MFDLKWTREAATQYQAIRDRALGPAGDKVAKRGADRPRKSNKAHGLFKQVVKTLEFLRTNPRHPGLRTHPYHSLTHPYDRDAKVFEAYVQNRTPGAYRVFWCYGPGSGEITVLAITPHP